MLSKSEEEIMEFLWERGPLFFKEIVDCYGPPAPAITTVATLLKRLQDKGAISFIVFGNSRQYKAELQKAPYVKNFLQVLTDKLFGKSPLALASFLTKNMDLSKADLEQLHEIIEKQLKK